MQQDEQVKFVLFVPSQRQLISGPKICFDCLWKKILFIYSNCLSFRSWDIHCWDATSIKILNYSNLKILEICWSNFLQISYKFLTVILEVGCLVMCVVIIFRVYFIQLSQEQGRKRCEGRDKDREERQIEKDTVYNNYKDFTYNGINKCDISYMSLCITVIRSHF